MSTNKAIYVEDTFSYGNYVCKVSKLQHMYVIGLILLSVLETTKKKTTGYIKFKVLNQINPNLGGLSKGSLLPPCSNKTTSLKSDTFIWIYIHILHLVCMILHLVCTDLSFNKKFEQEKNSLYKSISKSVYVDTYYLLLVIMITKCDVLPPSAKFYSLNHKKVVVLRA